MLKITRIYDEKFKDDGFRILVDRIWSRGIKKEDAGITLWLKDVAPSNELRKWFGHDENRWMEFKQKYFQELRNKENLLATIKDKMTEGNVTLLYSASNERFNNAVALKEYIERNN